VFRRLLVAAVTVACASAALPAANAEIIDHPTISDPSATALYDGFTGPFLVRFNDGPITTYQYSVIEDPAGAATVVQGPTNYPWNGSSGDHQISVAALGPGSYRFTISDSDTHTHEGHVDFTVHSGSPPKCSVVVPTKVRLSRPKVWVPGQLNKTCAALHTATADWKVARSGQVFDYYRFDGNTVDTWLLYDSDPIGSYAILPLSARSSDYTDVPQNSPTVVVRRDSRLGLWGSRSGSHVTLRTTLTVYSPSTHAFRPWAGRYVSLSYRTCSTCTWHQLRTLTTAADGEVSYRFLAPNARYYRVRASGNTLVWPALSRYEHL